MADSIPRNSGSNSPETIQSLGRAILFTLSSLVITFLYLFSVDFAKSYVVPPKHFPKRGWSQVFFKPKVNAPLIEPHPGSTDFKEVLQRGSELVSRVSTSDSWQPAVFMAHLIVPIFSIQIESTGSRIILTNGSLYPTR